jgi:HK97 family phage portal protein
MAAKSWDEITRERQATRGLQVIEGELVEHRSSTAAAELLGRTGSTLGAFRYGSWSQPLNLQQAAREGIRASAVVYRCAMAVAGAMAQLDLAVAGAGDQVVYDFAHPVAQLFNKRPNPLWSAAVYKLLIFLQMELVGQHFSYADRGPTGEGEISEIWPIFDPVELVVDDRTDPLKPALLGGRVLHNQGAAGLSTSVNGMTPLLPSELLWLRYPDPADPWGCLPPLRAAAWATDLDNYARMWQAGEFRNGGTPPGVVYLGDVSDEQFAQIKASYEARSTGPMNARRMLFTAGPTKPDFVRLGFNPAEMSYIQSREANSTDIMRAFGVSKDLLDGAATYENRREAKVHLWTETIMGKLQVIESEIDRQLLPEDALRAVFDVRKIDALRENADSISKRTSQDFRSGYTLIDEARAAIGLPALPNKAGQKLFVPRGATDAAAAEIGAVESPAEIAEAANEAQGALVDVGELSIRRESPAARRSPAPLDRAQIQRAYARFTAMGQRAVARLAGKQRAVVLRNLERQSKRSREGDLFDEAYWNEQTTDTLREWLTQVFEAGGERTSSALGLSFDTFSDSVLAKMQSRLEYLAGKVTRTTAEAIAKALLEPGVAAGEDVPDLAARLTAVFDELFSSRAELIARTETVSGFNAASRDAAQGSGIVTAKRWLTAGDGRVRDSHAAIDGEQVALDEPYSIGVMFPGDPDGDPEETVGCRCVEEYVLGEGGDAGETTKSEEA